MKFLLESSNNPSNDIKNEFDLWIGGGYDYSLFSPHSRDFIVNNLESTNKPLYRVEIKSKKRLDENKPLIFNRPVSFTKSWDSVKRIIKELDSDDEGYNIFITEGPVEYFDFDSLNLGNYFYGWQKEILTGGRFEIVENYPLDEITHIYRIEQFSAPRW